MQIFLEENYRSTGAILAASLAIISQGFTRIVSCCGVKADSVPHKDKLRIDKNLFTSHGLGPLPVLRECGTEYGEAEFMAQEIKRLIAYSGGQLTFNDFVILRASNQHFFDL